MIAALFKLFFFFFVKIPILLLVGFIKLVMLPFKLLGLFFTLLGFAKYAALAMIVYYVGRRVIGLLEERGAQVKFRQA